MIPAILVDLVSGDLPAAGGWLGWASTGGLGGFGLLLWRRMEAQTREVRDFHAGVAAEAKAHADARIAALEKDWEARYERMRVLLEQQADYARRGLVDCLEREKAMKVEQALMKAEIAELRARFD